MKIFLIVSIMAFICLGVNAQSNYKRGYIITNDNDSIAGWIDFRTDKMNQKQCKFKPSEQEKETIYLPGEIAGYRFTDEGNYYVSRDIEINEELQKVFLEYMVQGMMNLYSYYDGQQYFFFEDAAGKMTMVTKKPDEIKDSKYFEDKKYKGVLLYMFKDYAPVGDVVKKANFNQKSMIDIAKNIMTMFVKQEKNV